jgi:hypothetical protein
MKIVDTSEIHSVIESFKALYNQEMAKPNMFIIPYIESDEHCMARFEKIVSILKDNFEVSVNELSLESCGISNSEQFSDNIIFRCITVDSGKIEKIRDLLKEMLWQTNNSGEESPTLEVLINRNQDIIANNFKLSEYGIFSPYKIQKFNSIRTHSFNHKPVFYRYRLAIDKLERVHGKLQSYLELLLTDCPNHLFQQSNLRSSGQTCSQYNIDVQLNHTRKHGLLDLASASLSFEQFKSRHENLQKFLLLEDICTVATEVPLWLEPHEIKSYEELFQKDDVLTGHIDILRHEEDGRIGVWDYKPASLNEQNAVIQVFLYALMLSIRTGICLKYIICGYFDESDAFFFEPCQVKSFNGQLCSP